MALKACTTCTSSAVAPVGSVVSPCTSAPYTLYHCQTCKSRSFDVHEHEIDLSAFYEALAAADPAIADTPFQKTPYWDHEVAVIRRLLGRHPSSVLDVGCQAGDFLLHWPANMSRVGVELSHRWAEVARGRGLSVHHCSLEHLELEEQFDVVTCYAILEHLIHPRQFLLRLESLLYQGGLLAVMVPSFQTGKARFLEAIGYPWHMNRPPEHLNLYSRGFLDDFLGRRGFVVAARRYTSGGMFNPLRRIPGLGRGFARLMWWMDAYTPLNTLPIFDHMYTYYRKTGTASAAGASR